MLAFLMATRGWALLYYGRAVNLEGQTAALLKAFWIGFRFDLSAVGYLNTVPMLLFVFWWCLPRAWSGLIATRGFRVWLGIFVPLYVFITLVDFLFYDYFQDHLNTLIFGFLDDDTMALVRTMWKDYHAFVYIALLGPLVFFWWRTLGRLFPDGALGPARPTRRRRTAIAAPVALFVGVAIGARGGLAMFPLNVADASVSPSPFVNYLAWSGLHAFVRAIKLKKQMTTVWNINAEFFGYGSLAKAASDLFGIPEIAVPADPLVLLKRKTPQNPWAKKTRPHVVLIVMESFGTSWLKYHRDSFNLYGALERHFHADTTYENFFPSMTATIGSISALMINSPHRPFGEFLTEGRYFNVPFRTAPAQVFRQAGYQTRFLYGGAIGWRNVDRFARLQGFDSIEGDFQIERFEAETGHVTEKHDWGSHDDAVFRYLEDSLNKATQPQFVLVLTTTNHPPFQLPASYHPLPLLLPEELTRLLIVDQDTATRRFRAFQYSNQMLGELLDRVKAGPLGANTVIGVTGDHGFLLVNFEQEQLLQKWQVPFYLYLPPGARPAAKPDTKIFGSHPDIFPTLMEAALSETEYHAFGTNLLTAPADHPALHYSQLALSRDGGILAQRGADFTPLKWDPPYEKLSAAEPTPALRSLATRYKSTMAFLDFFYENERTRTTRSTPTESSHADPRR